MKNIVDVFQAALGRDGITAAFSILQQSIQEFLSFGDMRIECCMCCCCPDGCC